MLKKAYLALSALIALSLILSACTTPQVVVQTVVVQATAGPKQPELLMFHWWTAPSERDAARAMIQVMGEKYPDIRVVENPVPGGGGVSQRVVLQARMTAGFPPDTFQTLSGAEMKAYVDAGQLEPLDDLWAELDYAAKLPGPLAKAVSVDGKYYVVPINMHIQNLLYYNQALFSELSLTPPTTHAELLAVCDAIREARPAMSCLGLGSKEKWGAAFLFDTMFMEAAGPADYVAFYKGEIDPATFAPFRTALEQFAALIPYINSDHAALTWDQATALLPAGKSAMTVMGTWALGALQKDGGWQAGEDFGVVTFPQKPQRILLFHSDAYGLPKGAPSPDVTRKWLEVAASPELQIATDIIQGGLFARLDIDPAEFPDPVRQELMQYVRDHPDMLILSQHGSISPTGFTSEYWGVLVNFLAQPDIDAAIDQVAGLMTQFNVKDASAWYQWP